MNATATWSWTCNECKETQSSHFHDDAMFMWRVHARQCPAVRAELTR